jgi:hypothetical protein
VLRKLQILLSKKQKEILDFVEFLEHKQNTTKRPRREWVGTASDLRVYLTEEDIAEARREMWGNFPV